MPLVHEVHFHRENVEMAKGGGWKRILQRRKWENGIQIL
jgi:hypothetical protein